MEQLVARRAHNPKVVGSSPAAATKIKGNHSWFPFLFIQITFQSYSFKKQRFFKASIHNLNINMKGLSVLQRIQEAQMFFRINKQIV